jgi:hypothetical protein
MTPVHDPRFGGAHRQAALDYARQENRRAERRAYIIPLVMLAVGWLAMIAYPVIADRAGLLDAMAATGVWLLILAISMVAGLLGLIVTCKLFGDDAGNLLLALIRLAGIYAIVMVVGTLLSGLMCLGFALTLAIMAGLVALLFEMEFKEGVVVAVVTWLAWLVTALGVGAMLG